MRQASLLESGLEQDANLPQGNGSPRRITAGGIPIRFRPAATLNGPTVSDLAALKLHLEHSRLRLLRGFDQLLCLEGVTGVEQLPHQIETVRKVLRHFRGRVLLADEVGLGKTIEACLLLREYVLRGLVRRVLILVPAPLVSQWDAELREKFHLEFTVPTRTGGDDPRFWTGADRVLTSLHYAKGRKRAELVAAAPWDLVIVDEAHHCKNRTTKNWQLVNSLQRKHMFLLTATPVQNNLLELYNLLTLLEPGHLKTEADFKKQYVKRGNPRDPRNRERLRSLLGEVMVRNTRSLVHMDLPPRYAQTVLAQPDGEEAALYRELAEYLRMQRGDGTADKASRCRETGKKPLTRMQLTALLAAQGSHPAALIGSLEKRRDGDEAARRLIERAERVPCSAKDERLLELVRQSEGHKLLVFVNFRRTLARLKELLREAGVPFATYSGEQSGKEKDAAVERFRDEVPVMLCTESGGEGRNLQFADTLVNYDLPWNPMRIEQRIGRVHRIGQTREVFVFNLCTAGSLEDRILRLLDEKIRMFELVVGEVGSILGNLEGGEEFESLVLNLWLKSRDEEDLTRSFDALGDSLLDAQQDYLHARELDEALFGEDFQ